MKKFFKASLFVVFFVCLSLIISCESETSSSSDSKKDRYAWRDGHTVTIYNKTSSKVYYRTWPCPNDPNFNDTSYTPDLRSLEAYESKTNEHVYGVTIEDGVSSGGRCNVTYNGVEYSFQEGVPFKLEKTGACDIIAYDAVENKVTVANHTN